MVSDVNSSKPFPFESTPETTPVLSRLRLGPFNRARTGSSSGEALFFAKLLH
jgi:hypothetical protein